MSSSVQFIPNVVRALIAAYRWVNAFMQGSLSLPRQTQTDHRTSTIIIEDMHSNLNKPETPPVTHSKRASSVNNTTVCIYIPMKRCYFHPTPPTTKSISGLLDKWEVVTWTDFRFLCFFRHRWTGEVCWHVVYVTTACRGDNVARHPSCQSGHLSSSYTRKPFPDNV